MLGSLGPDLVAHHVRVVSEAEFSTWVEEAKKKFAANGIPTNVATANLAAE